MAKSGHTEPEALAEEDDVAGDAGQAQPHGQQVFVHQSHLSGEVWS
jgi:hypothetical protein